MVIYRFRCILCGVTKDYEYGRRTSSNRYHTAVMLGALMVFKGMKVDLARSTYSATTFRRKTLCNLHFAEAVSLLCFKRYSRSPRRAAFPQL
ncbi:unnamed protein product [Heligmosomoides polygyrus]|uniref:Transposase n=1 Tax=Heligmosomoides polygyrus TaxID=6339 RepID=A0A183FKY1_HELPZ|nr:unnamed protein product [Heligmosomoides polygyrus]